MDRRLFLTGSLGVGATTIIATVLPREAHALVAAPPGEQASGILPQLDVFPEGEDPAGELDEDIELISHRRRRRRVRRWRRRCRRYWYNGHWRRRCRRVPYWIWIWFNI